MVYQTAPIVSCVAGEVRVIASGKRGSEAEAVGVRPREAVALQTCSDGGVLTR